MCYLAVFGTKSVCETKVPATVRAQFHNYIMDLHKADGAGQKFAEASSWRAYVRATHPSRRKHETALWTRKWHPYLALMMVMMNHLQLGLLHRLHLQVRGLAM